MPVLLSTFNAVAGEIKLRYQEPYVTEGLNAAKAVIVPRGTHRGFRLGTNVAALSVSIVPDPTWNDHVAQYLTTDANDPLGYGHTLTIRRVGGEFTVSLASLPSSTLVIAIQATYGIGNATAAVLNAYTLSEYNSLLTDQSSELIVLGMVTTPGSGAIPAGNIVHSMRVFAGNEFGQDAVPFIRLADDPAFSQVGFPTNTSISGIDGSTWFFEDGSSSVVGTWIQSGSSGNQLNLAVTATSSVNFEFYPRQPAITVQQGQVLRTRIDLKALKIPSSGTIQIQPVYLNITGGTVATTDTYTIPISGVDANFRTIDQDFTVPQGAVYITKLRLFSTAVAYSSTGNVLVVEAFQFWLETLGTLNELDGGMRPARMQLSTLRFPVLGNQPLPSDPIFTNAGNGTVVFKRADDQFTSSHLAPNLVVAARLIAGTSVSGFNQDGVDGQGSGTGYGVWGVGGPIGGGGSFGQLGSGVVGVGGTNGNGVSGFGTGQANGVFGLGSDSGPGVAGAGGANSAGGFFSAGSGSGQPGLISLGDGAVEGAVSSYGVAGFGGAAAGGYFEGGTGQPGVIAQGGSSNSNGINGFGSGTGQGGNFTGGTTGVGGIGCYGEGGGTASIGVSGQGSGTGAGVVGNGDSRGNGAGGEFNATGSSDGVDATGSGSGAGVVATGGNGTGFFAGTGVSGTGGTNGYGGAFVAGASGPAGIFVSGGSGGSLGGAFQGTGAHAGLESIGGPNGPGATFIGGTGNADGLDATATGTGIGLAGTGRVGVRGFGTTGDGVEGTAQGSSGFGGNFQGAGTSAGTQSVGGSAGISFNCGAGGVFQGGSTGGGGNGGAGVVGIGTGNQPGGAFTAGTVGDAAVEVLSGPATFNTDISSGTIPNAAPLPRSIYGDNIVKAWGIITTDGVGGATLVTGFNIASVATAGGFSVLDVGLVTHMTTTNYLVICTGSNSTLYSGLGSSGVGSFELSFSSDPATTVMAVHFILIGVN